MMLRLMLRFLHLNSGVTWLEDPTLLDLQTGHPEGTVQTFTTIDLLRYLRDAKSISTFWPS